VLVGELEGLHETEGLINITSHGEVVDGDLAEIALIVDDEKPTESDALILLENSIVACDLAGLVLEKRDFHLSETALFTRSVYPCEMTEHTVSGTGHDLAVDGTELLSTVTEGDDLSWAHKCEVQRVEEEYNIFALVIIKTDFLEFTVDNGISLEVGGGFCKLSLRHLGFQNGTNEVAQ